MMSALDFAFGPTSEIVIAGEKGAEDTKKVLAALNREFIPGKVVILRAGKDSEITGIAEYTRNMPGIEGSATLYVCRNYSCRLPVTKTGEMLELLKEL